MNGFYNSWFVEKVWAYYSLMIELALSLLKYSMSVLVTRNNKMKVRETIIIMLYQVSFVKLI